MKTLKILLFWLLLALAPPISSYGAAPGVSGEFDINWATAPIGSQAITNYPISGSVKDYNATGNGTTDDYANIMLAIAGTPNYTSLYFPAGTYVVRTPITMGSYYSRDKPIQFVGENPASTIIRAETGNSATGSTIIARGGQYGSDLMINGVALRGATTITLASVTGLAVGNTVRIAQTNNPALVTGWTPTGSSDPDLDRYICHGQISKITAINGLNVTISQPLCENLTNGFFRKFDPYRGFGLLNMGLANTNNATSTSCIDFYGCENGWLIKCIIHKYDSYGATVAKCNQMTIRQNWFKDATRKSSSVYCIYIGGGACNILIDHNRFERASSSLLFQYGASLCAVFGNYFHQTWTLDYRGDGPQNCLAAPILFHGGAPHHILVEGNVGGKAMVDDVWGTGGRYIIFYRNWWTRDDPTLTEPDLFVNCISGIESESSGRYILSIANVIGMLGQAGSGKASETYHASMVSTVQGARNYWFEDGAEHATGGLSVTTPDASLLYPTSYPAPANTFNRPFFGPDVNNKTNSYPPIPAIADFFGLTYPTPVDPPPPSEGPAGGIGVLTTPAIVADIKYVAFDKTSTDRREVRKRRVYR